MKYTEMKNPERRYFNNYDKAQSAWSLLEHIGVHADVLVV